MKFLGRLIWLILLLFVLILQISCSSSRKMAGEGETTAKEAVQDDYDEIERLLGITREEQDASKVQPQASQTTGKETEQKDELIKLLEADEGTKKTTPTVEKPTEDKRLVRLQKQVETLQRELKKKDLEIADLRAQLMLKSETEGSRESSWSRQISQSHITPSSSGVVSESYKAKYQHALKLFHEKRYRAALEAFEQLLAMDMNNDYSDNAQYWIGECYYAMGRYREAIIAFEKVFTFRYSNKNDYAQFKIGQCYFMLGDKQRARQEFQVLLDNYPDSELVQRANEYLAQL